MIFYTTPCNEMWKIVFISFLQCRSPVLSVVADHLQTCRLVHSEVHWQVCLLSNGIVVRCSYYYHERRYNIIWPLTVMNTAILMHVMSCDRCFHRGQMLVSYSVLVVSEYMVASWWKCGLDFHVRHEWWSSNARSESEFCPFIHIICHLYQIRRIWTMDLFHDTYNCYSTKCGRL